MPPHRRKGLTPPTSSQKTTGFEGEAITAMGDFDHGILVHDPVSTA